MNNNTKANVSSIAIPIALAFVASMILLVVTGSPITTLFEGMIGAVSKTSNITTMLKNYITPLIFTGVSVAFAFRGGLFNIGAEGQFLFGGSFGIFCGIAVHNTLPPALAFIVTLVAGAVGGALMGVIPGILKAVARVNEVVICIMMNYVALYLSAYLVNISGVNGDGRNTATVPLKSSVSSLIEPFGPFLRIDLMLAIAALIFFYVVIKKTTFGYELRASGLSANAAEYAGMAVKKNVVLTMAISGAIAGLGGVLYLFATTTVIAPEPKGFTGYGFSGIAVALLGMSTPIGVLLAGLLFSVLSQTGKEIALLYVPPISQQISNIMTAFIVFFVAFQPSIRKRLLTKLTLRDIKKKGGTEQ